MVNISYLDKLEKIHSLPQDVVGTSLWQNALEDELLLLYLLDKCILNIQNLNKNQREALSQSILRFNSPALYASLLSQKGYTHTLFQGLQKHYHELYAQTGFLFQALRVSYLNITHIPASYLNEKILQWYCLEYHDRDIVKLLPVDNITLCVACLLVSQNHLNFKSLPEKMRNNVVVFETIDEKHHVDVYPHAGHHIQSNPYISQQVITKQPQLYRYAGDALKTPEFFLRQLRLTYELLKYAPEHIKDNELCVWESVKKTPHSLLYASQRLLSLPTFCLQLCKEMPKNVLRDTFNIWSESIRDNKELMSELMERLSDSESFCHIGQNVREDKEFMTQAVLYHWKNVMFLGAKLCDDELYLFSLMKKLQTRKHNDLLGKKIYEFLGSLPDRCFENSEFLLGLYDNFTDDFENFIYPHISYKQTEYIEEMNNSKIARENGISSFFDKIRLYKQLENKLSHHTSRHDVHKI